MHTQVWIEQNTAGAFAKLPPTLSLWASPGLARHGRLVVMGSDQGNIPVQSVQLLQKSRAIVGHASGSCRDSQVRT